MAKPQLRLSTMAVALAMAGMTSTAALAGGFGIGTQSGSGTGNAFAGGAAVADDASVAWSNPAGMTLLPMGKQVTAAGHFVVPSFQFNNNGSTVPGVLGSGNGGDGGGFAVIPNGFFTMSINPNLRFGLALNVPFGLGTKYDQGWLGQTVALESDIKTININPSLAYKVSDKLSVGAGISVQRIEAKLTRYAGNTFVGNAVLEADDVGFGFNFGAMIQATPSTRIGISYRSAIEYDLEGAATFTGTLGPASNVGARASIKVPDSASLSVLSAMGSQWEVMADLTYTGWSSIKRLDVFRTAAAGGLVPGAAGSQIGTADIFNWKDTLRVGVGANYKMNPQTKLRFGLAFDPTPTNDVDRTARLPDQDRTWIAFGVQYKPSKEGVIEIGYAHEFIKDATVNNAAAAGRLIGSYNSKADILSVQYSHKF